MEALDTSALKPVWQNKIVNPDGHHLLDSLRSIHFSKFDLVAR